MNSILRQDIGQLLGDLQKVQGDLELLEKDHDAWCMKDEQKGLQDLCEHVGRLGGDVSILKGDCVALGHAYRGADDFRHVLDSLRRAFVSLNALYNDLKELRRELEESCMFPGVLGQLQTDWVGFSKTVREIEKALRNGEDSVKGRNIVVSNEEGSIVWPSSASWKTGMRTG